MSRNAISEIWYTRCPVPTPVGLADQLGWLRETFKEEGIELKSIIDSPSRDVRQSHFNHTLDWSFRHGGNVPPIRARSEGRIFVSALTESLFTFRLSNRLSSRGSFHSYSTHCQRVNLFSSCRNLIGYSRRHFPSRVSPATQTVSVYLSLGCGSALTSANARSIFAA